MRRIMKSVLSFCALSTLCAAPVLAAGGNDEFGENFTAQAPAALQEDAGADYSGEALNEIAPAAGEAVWIPPEEEKEKLPAAIPDIEGLLGPDFPLVPGMDMPPEAVLETIN